MKLRPLLLASCLALGCAQPVRFADRAILWRDPDEGPTPFFKRHNPSINWSGARDAIFLPADHFFGADYFHEADNVNALDELPDSSWWQDRRRDPAAPAARPRALTDEIVNGAFHPEDQPVPPFTIVNGKPIGATPGFIVEDSRHQRYAFKLDPKGRKGFVTSTELVASRLGWAAGYLVPGETLLDVRRDQLEVSPNAHAKGPLGKRVPFTRGDLDAMLSRCADNADGSYRAIASVWIPGRSVGWFHYFGRDRRDLNDRILHEDRRDLRGFGVWAAWVNDIDVFDNNTLDSYVGEPDRGHILHYQQDVGGSFGNFAAAPAAYWMSEEIALSPVRIIGSFLTLGALPRRWDGQRWRDRVEALDARWPELGPFEAERFEPRAWRPMLDNPAFVRQTKRDRYWGAKLVLAVSAPELRAAVGTGRYSTGTSERLFDVLWRRREKIGRAYLSEVAPLDYFRVRADRLCFDDLWVDQGFGGDGGTTYVARERGAGQVVVDHRCVTLPPSGGYQVIELRVIRPGERKPGPAVRVHLVEDAGQPRRIVGIER